MPTLNTAPSLSAYNSGDITVTAAAPVNVGLYTAVGGAIPQNVVAAIARKNPSGTYSPSGEALTGARPNGVLTAAGVYQVQKPATDVAVGVMTD